MIVNESRTLGTNLTMWRHTIGSITWDNYSFIPTHKRYEKQTKKSLVPKIKFFDIFECYQLAYHHLFKISTLT